MTTKETVAGYLECVRLKQDWAAFLAEDMVFTSHTSPVKQLSGKRQFLQATQKFYSSIQSVDVCELLAEQDRACAMTRYEIQPANGAAHFASDVAEFFSVRDGKITSFSICFDTCPYPK